jgi:hypothetical protein
MGVAKGICGDVEGGVVIKGGGDEGYITVDGGLGGWLGSRLAETTMEAKRR